jgi:hypothetical protein
MIFAYSWSEGCDCELVSAAHFIEQLLNQLFQHGRHFFVNNFFVGLVSSYRARVDRLTEA